MGGPERKEEQLGQEVAFSDREQDRNNRKQRRNEEDLALMCRQKIRMVPLRPPPLYRPPPDDAEPAGTSHRSHTADPEALNLGVFSVRLRMNNESHPPMRIVSERALIVSALVFVNITEQLFPVLNQQPVDKKRRRCKHCVGTHRKWALSASGSVTYRKACGQSSLDIHCHSICAGVGKPRAVHLRVGLLPYG